MVSVRQTTNGGGNWTAAEGNLPDMPVRWVLPDPGSRKRALLATEFGVWSTEDLTASPVVWSPSNTNLANVRVDMLRLRKADLTVAAATHGRGLFTSNVFGASPLPIELTAFTAAAESPSAVRLAWATASEKNSARFEVERSPDGHRFGRVATLAGAGSSSTPHAYRLTDANLPAAPTLYYRLRQVDTVGSFSYSPVRTVARVVGGGSLTIFPNPARSTATLTGATGNAPVQVVDALGRLKATATTDASGRASLIPAGGLAPGTYVVRVGARSSRLVVE